MLHYPVPLKVFELVEDNSLYEFFQVEDERHIGFPAEVDLENSDELHDKNADYSLVADKETIDTLELNDLQTSLKTPSNWLPPNTISWDRPSTPWKTMWFTIVTSNSTLTTASKLKKFIKL